MVVAMVMVTAVATNPLFFMIFGGNFDLMWFGWGFWMWGPICLVLIAVAIYYVVTSSSSRHNCSLHSHNQQSQYHSGQAVEILKERYAKGEITKEQFLQMRDELK